MADGFTHLDIGKICKVEIFATVGPKAGKSIAVSIGRLAGYAEDEDSVAWAWDHVQTSGQIEKSKYRLEVEQYDLP